METDFIKPGTEVYAVHSNPAAAESPRIVEGVVTEVTIKLCAETTYLISTLDPIVQELFYDAKDVFTDREAAQTAVNNVRAAYIKDRKQVLTNRIAEYEHRLQEYNRELKELEQI